LRRIYPVVVQATHGISSIKGVIQFLEAVKLVKGFQCEINAIATPALISST